MPPDPTRPIRLRWGRLTEPVGPPGRPRTPELDAAPASATPRFLARIYDGGAMPAATGRVFLANPATLDGPEAEGAAAGVAFDASRPIPILVLGSVVPKAGDLVHAFAVGGRWVASLHAQAPPPDCGGCTAPQKDLTVSWANSLSGPGSTKMAFDGVDEWRSGCANQMRFRLSCRDGGATFQATYYSGGPCPSGQPSSCTGPGPSPLGLALSLSSCSPFLLQYDVSATTCPALASRGYNRFTITL